MLKRLKQLQPVKLQDYLLLGQARLYRNEQEGLALLDEAVKLDKTNVVSRLVRGKSLIHLAKVFGNPTHAEAALGDLRTATELLDANAFLLSRTLEARLIAASTDKLTQFPNNYRTNWWRAFYFDYLGDDTQALQSWRAMKNTRIAYFVIALFRLGKFDEALQLCDERLERYPGARFTEYFRALLLSTQTDDPGEALAAFVRENKETLDRFNAHRFHYVVYCLAGQLQQAQRYSRQVRDSAQEFAAHGWHAQLLNYRSGDLDEQTLLAQAAHSAWHTSKRTSCSACVSSPRETAPRQATTLRRPLNSMPSRCWKDRSVELSSPNLSATRHGPLNQRAVGGWLALGIASECLDAA